jgi:hypothetical protein
MQQFSLPHHHLLLLPQYEHHFTIIFLPKKAEHERNKKNMLYEESFLNIYTKDIFA